MADKQWTRRHDNGWASFVGQPEGSDRFVMYDVGGIPVKNLGSQGSLAAAQDAPDAEVAALGHTCSDKCGSWSS